MRMRYFHLHNNNFDPLFYNTLYTHQYIVHNVHFHFHKNQYIHLFSNHKHFHINHLYLLLFHRLFHYKFLKFLVDNEVLLIYVVKW